MISFSVTEETKSITFNISSDTENIESKINEVFIVGQGVNSYLALDDKPLLNGKVIEGNMNEIDPTVPSWAKQAEKPSYNISEINNGMDERNTIPLSTLKSFIN